MSQVQEVKESTDIIEIIGARVSLQRSGKYFKGNCPFHSERSPSFFVDPVLQRYKCFGCGESGDVINFLEKFEGMTFSEALEDLAQRAGIELKKYVKTKQDTLRDELLEILDLAKQYYHYLLTEHKSGEVARTYLKERKISSESIKLFQMGFALEQWDGLIKYLHNKKKYKLSLLEQAGLVIKGRRGRYYDRFRGRIIFPLKDHRGRVVGFSGRKIAGDEKDAKYINSPETILYHKSKMLFGFSELYQQIRKAGHVVVVEGEFDVVSSTQAHMDAIVAIKGSALTEDHAKLLQRTVDKVILSLDTDSAGVAATKKAITALKKTDLELRVIKLPGGKDPDELIKSDPKLWREAVKHSVTAHEFLIDVAFEQYDSNSPEGKRNIIQDLLPSLADIKHAVELEHYQKNIAQRLGVKLESVKKDLQVYQKTGKIDTTKVQEPEKEVVKSESARTKLEKYLLFLLFQSDSEILFQRLRELEQKQISLELAGVEKLLKLVQEYSGPWNMKAFALSLPEDLQELLFELHTNEKYLSNTTDLNMGAEWSGTLKKLQKLSVTQRKSEIITEISKLDELDEMTSDQAKQHADLLKELVRLNSQEKTQ